MLYEFNYELQRHSASFVLILILMEYALRGEAGSSLRPCNHLVLILILMEYALRVNSNSTQLCKNYKSLNPYSNGICSTRSVSVYVRSMPISLNPYSNGICSTRDLHSADRSSTIVVLILILMEYALRGQKKIYNPHSQVLKYI